MILNKYFSAIKYLYYVEKAHIFIRKIETEIVCKLFYGRLAYVQRVLQRRR